MCYLLVMNTTDQQVGYCNLQNIPYLYDRNREVRQAKTSVYQYFITNPSLSCVSITRVRREIRFFAGVSISNGSDQCAALSCCQPNKIQIFTTLRFSTFYSKPDAATITGDLMLQLLQIKFAKKIELPYYLCCNKYSFFVLLSCEGIISGSLLKKGKNSWA